MELKLKPYKGGASPSEEQVAHNNKVLGQELKKLNIPFEENTEYANEMWGGKDTLLKIIHPKDKGQYVMVGYDRWGFVIDNDPEIDCDQWGLESTLEAIKKWYGTN